MSLLADRRPRISGPLQVLGAFLREEAAFLLLALGYCAFVMLLGQHLRAGGGAEVSLYSEPFVLLLLAFAAAFLIGHPVHVMVFKRPHRLSRAILADWRGIYLTPARLGRALPVLLVLPAFLSAFTLFKTLIPEIAPFSWDPALAAADRWLHGGRHPWELLQPLFGTATATAVLNFFYHLWFFVVFGSVFWQAFSLADRPLRQQFFLSFLLLWMLLGGLGAVLLSSAGPVYFGRVTGLNDPYQPLMAYLRQAAEVAPIWALEVQEALWRGYQGRALGPGAGISAMPSMHVACAVLLVLLGWRRKPWLGWAFAIFAGLILVGSVHLGWHYAIDGYVSIGLTILIWKVTGKILNRNTAK